MIDYYKRSRILAFVAVSLLALLMIIAAKYLDEREHAAALDRCYVQTATECRKLMEENAELRKVVENYGQTD